MAENDISNVIQPYSRVSEVIYSLRELARRIESVNYNQTDFLVAVKLAIKILNDNGINNVLEAGFYQTNTLETIISQLEKIGSKNDEANKENDNEENNKDLQSKLDKMTIDELVEDYERALAEKDNDLEEKIESVFEAVERFIQQLKEQKSKKELGEIFKDIGQKNIEKVEERLKITEDEKNNVSEEKKTDLKENYVKSSIEIPVEKIVEVTVQRQVENGDINEVQAQQYKEKIKEEILRSLIDGDKPRLTEIGSETGQKVELKKTEEIIDEFRKSQEKKVIEYQIAESNLQIAGEMREKGAKLEQIELVQKFNSEVIRQSYETGTAQMREQIQQEAGEKWMEAERIITVAAMDPAEFERINQIYLEIEKQVPVDARPTRQNQYRITDDLFHEIYGDSTKRELLTRAQEKIGIQRKIEEGKQRIAGRLAGKVVESRFGKWLSGKIGDEAARNIIGGVAKNIAEKGLVRGLTESLIGIANGTLKAGTMPINGGVFTFLSKMPLVGKIFSPLAKLEGWWGGIKNSALNWGKGALKDVGLWAKGAVKSGLSKLASGVGSLIKGIGSAATTAGTTATGAGTAAAGTPVWVIVLIILLILFLLSIIQSDLASSLVPADMKISECIPAEKATEIINSGRYTYREIVRDGERLVCYEPKENIPGIGNTLAPQEGLSGMIVEGECSVADKVVLTKQCGQSWSDKPLPAGCTICKAGCGPSSVSMMTRRVDGSTTPDKIIETSGSAYSGIGCDGSSLGQASTEISKKFPGAVTYDATTRSCDKKTIANWICNGKIVMVLANFYRNKNLDVGGHFVLAVAVKNGEVVTADPYYSVATPFDGKQEYGHVQRIFECLTVEAGAIK
jgi:hypothetical protein